MRIRKMKKFRIKNEGNDGKGWEGKIENPLLNLKYY